MLKVCHLKESFAIVCDAHINVHGTVVLTSACFILLALFNANSG